MSDDLKSCPFCGSDDLGSGGDDKVVGYWCNSCQAAGPNHYGRYEWNSRADRIEELEAKLSESEALLAKAVEALELLHDNVVQAWPSVAYLGPVANASTTLAELTGGKDE